MDTSDIVTLCLSGVAILVSIIVAIVEHRRVTIQERELAAIQERQLKLDVEQGLLHKRQVELAEQALGVDKGGRLSQLRSAIANAQALLDEAGLAVSKAKDVATAKKSKQSRIQFETATKRFDMTVEAWLNAFEDACSNYINRTVEAETFKKMFFTEIRNLLEKDEDFARRYFTEPVTRYQQILLVYREWHRP